MLLRAEVPFSQAERLIAAVKDLESHGVPVNVYSVDEDLPEISVDTCLDPRSAWWEYSLGNDVY